MDKDQVGGKFDQAVGHVKQGIGEAVGNERLANEGVADQVKGSAKETWGNVKDAARTTGESNREAAHANANDTRESVAGKVQDIKEKVNDKIDEFKDRHRESA